MRQRWEPVLQVEHETTVGTSAPGGARDNGGNQCSRWSMRQRWEPVLQVEHETTVGTSAPGGADP
ncbi:hypothetical protein BgiBS90_007045, partial [Biomphalaria glabrata]